MRTVYDIKLSKQYSLEHDSDLFLLSIAHAELGPEINSPKGATREIIKPNIQSITFKTFLPVEDMKKVFQKLADDLVA